VVLEATVEAHNHEHIEDIIKALNAEGYNVNRVY